MLFVFLRVGAVEVAVAGMRDEPESFWGGSYNGHGTAG